MSLSRVLRVILTIILVIGFIVVSIAAYRRNQRVNSMTTLSDATTSITTALASEDLAWRDQEGTKHPYILDQSSFGKQDFNKNLAGENFVFRVLVTYLKDDGERIIGPYGPKPENDRMTCSLTAPTALRVDGRSLPAKMRVVVWYA